MAAALARIDFGRPRRGVARADAIGEVEALCAELRRRGFVVGEPTVAGDVGGVFAITTWPARAWFARSRRDEELAVSWQQLERHFTAAASASWIGAVEAPASTSPDRCRRLLLWANVLDRDHVVRDYDSGAAIPLPALPIDPYLARELTSWASTLSDCDSLWFGSGALERASYRQLSEWHSPLDREAEEVAGRLSVATGLLVYRYLVRYGGLAKSEADRPCPGCGRRWRRQPHGGWGFTFRCDGCRVASHQGASR